MLKLTIYILVVLLVGIVWGLPASDTSDDGESGYCKIDGLRIKNGETVPAPIGKCWNYICHKTESNNVLSLTCPEWQLAGGSKCHKSELDLTKPYPECCPYTVCDEE